MTKLLLDFPWELSEVLDAGSELPKVLLEFKRLIARTGLDLVPFIEDEEAALFWNQISARRKGSIFGALAEFVHHCRRNTVGSCVARPDPEPPRLRDSWKYALREEIKSSANWRNPQLIVTKQRRPEWLPVHGHEVNIHCEQCGEEPASGPHNRVLAVLEDYEKHPFAISDLDPWDVRCTVPHTQHPCYLPNPLIPDGDPLKNYHRRALIKNLSEKLAITRAKGWRINDKYFYIPPANWRPEIVDPHVWREGHAFPRGYSAERDRMGYLDYEGRLWVWHNEEQHWDVQKGGTDYDSINHTGDLL